MPSLFEIVQGRVAPVAPVQDVAPPAAQPAQSPFPPMPAPGTATGYLYGGTEDFGRPVSGYMHGGMEHLGFEGDYAPMYMENDSNASTDRYVADGVMNIPGYAGGSTVKFGANPTDSSGQPSQGTWNNKAGSGSNTFSDSFSAAPTSLGNLQNPLGAIYSMASVKGPFGGVSPRTNQLFDLSNPADLKILDESVTEYERRNQQDKADALALRNGGSGPDHFYEQLAYNTQKDAENRKDMQMQADAQQAAIQQKAIADWRIQQQQAAQARQNNITNAGATAQSSFLSGVKMADPAQGNVLFDPYTLYNDAVNGNPNNSQTLADQNMPNIPGYVFNKSNGGQ